MTFYNLSNWPSHRVMRFMWRFHHMTLITLCMDITY